MALLELIRQRQRCVRARQHRFGPILLERREQAASGETPPAPAGEQQRTASSGHIEIPDRLRRPAAERPGGGSRMEEERLKAILESLLFAAGEPVPLARLAAVLDNVARDAIRQALGEMIRGLWRGRARLDARRSRGRLSVAHAQGARALRAQAARRQAAAAQPSAAGDARDCRLPPAGNASGDRAVARRRLRRRARDPARTPPGAESPGARKRPGVR